MIDDGDKGDIKKFTQISKGYEDERSIRKIFKICENRYPVG